MTLSATKRSGLVERMPVLDEATLVVRRPGSVPAAASTSHGPSPKIPNGVAKLLQPLSLICSILVPMDVPPPGSSGGDFLHDLLGVDVFPSPQGTNHVQKSGTDVLMDLLSIGTPPAQSSSSAFDILSSNQDNKSSVDVLSELSSPLTPAQTSSPVGSSSMMDLLGGFGTSPSLPAVAETNGPIYPTIVAFESSSLKVTFNFSKEPGSLQTTIIEAQFMNKSPDVYSNFVFQAAVPKFLQLHLDPASGNTLPASSNGYITQKLKVSNSQHGKKALVMRVRINYKVKDKDVLEEGQINNFPRDL
ncbi:ap-1 complex subunit gamma-1 [Phtheirospermum japonicum]|uniref:Ap-1 complex subunit gamma-1 n=1 Tax=Phtheirospermum japonicum TaxID=374723 RepID=A0A830B419_9LAMI|nr:ap-1 complex subunit gamma-1 [Phtheirospermum japonicum]